MAIASLVLGITAIPLCFIFIPALLAVIFGVIALGQIKANPGQSGRGQAIAGLILGGVSLLIIVLAIALTSTSSFEIQSTFLAMA